MTDDIKALQEKLKRLKLEKDIKKLGGKLEHEKKETKKHEIKEHKESYSEEKARDNIKRLQEQKAQYGGGVRNFLRKANVQAQINEQAKYLKEKQKVRVYGETTERLNAQARMLEAANKVNSLRNVNKVNFESQLPFQPAKKQITYGDLFK